MGNQKQQPNRQKTKPNTPWYTRKAGKWLIGIFGGILLLLLAVYIAFRVSPWPNSLLIRYEFDKNGAKVAKALEKHMPQGVRSIDDQPYQPNSKDGFLDVFYPEKTYGTLPTIVWVHGGAWVSGDKNDIDNYLRILASYGYTTIGVDYSIAPESQYPTPLLQLNTALEYIQNNAPRLHVDTNNIVLAGDSAGSQIVAQMANIVTSPAYAKEVGITPTLAEKKLRGMILNCGAYDLALPDYNGPFGSFLHTVLWAYSGTKDFLHNPKLRPASVANYLTEDFPPSFITAGNADPLEQQSRELARRLQAHGVFTSTLFYSADHQPQLPHEYQFNLDNNDGKNALRQMRDFLKRTVPSPGNVS